MDGTVLTPSSDPNAIIQSQTFPVSTINRLEDTAQSWYDAGYVNVRRKYSHGLSFLANYTFAKTLTNAPDFRSPMDEAAIPQNNSNLAAEKGPGCDVRHPFALSSVFDIPAYAAATWTRMLTQNWHFTTIYQVQSGMPLTISVFGDTANSGTVLGENPIRANVTGQPVFGAGTRTADKWVQPGSFRGAARVHFWQCRTELGLRSSDADPRPRAGAHVPSHREGQFPVSGRGLQCAQQDQLGDAEPVCEYSAVRYHYHGHDAGTGDSVEREGVVLILKIRRQIADHEEPG